MPTILSYQGLIQRFSKSLYSYFFPVERKRSKYRVLQGLPLGIPVFCIHSRKILGLYKQKKLTFSGKPFSNQWTQVDYVCRRRHREDGEDYQDETCNNLSSGLAERARPRCDFICSHGCSHRDNKPHLLTTLSPLIPWRH